MISQITSKKQSDVANATPIAFGTLGVNASVPLSYTPLQSLVTTYDSHSCVSSNQNFIVPAGYAGIWCISFSVYVYGALGFAQYGIGINAANPLAHHRFRVTVTNTNESFCGSQAFYVNLAAGDVVNFINLAGNSGIQHAGAGCPWTIEFIQ